MPNIKFIYDDCNTYDVSLFYIFKKMLLPPFSPTGEEPILVKVETRDINSVAGVLKLYFRELSEPLFPLQLFDELVACTKYNTEGEWLV